MFLDLHCLMGARKRAIQGLTSENLNLGSEVPLTSTECDESKAGVLLQSGAAWIPVQPREDYPRCDQIMQEKVFLKILRTKI
jgi:hypothetical protein